MKDGWQHHSHFTFYYACISVRHPEPNAGAQQTVSLKAQRYSLHSGINQVLIPSIRCQMTPDKLVLYFTQSFYVRVISVFTVGWMPANVNKLVSSTACVKRCQLAAELCQFHTVFKEGY